MFRYSGKDYHSNGLSLKKQQSAIAPHTSIKTGIIISLVLLLKIEAKSEKHTYFNGNLVKIALIFSFGKHNLN